jgi:hypothetical protein
MRPVLLLLALLAAPSALAQRPFVITSPSPGSAGGFGQTVAGVPDVNGDERGDFLVGADSEGGFPRDGRAHLFSGATGAVLRTLVSPNWQFNGDFGSAVAGLPDIDGDGRGDLLVGATLEDLTSGGTLYADAGRAYVFSGATGAPLHTLESPNPQQGTTNFPVGYATAVAGVPDADGDGRGDLLVGAYGENVGTRPRAGRAYLYSGASGAPLRTLLSPTPRSYSLFGRAVSGIGDVNGDGRGDLLVGAHQESVGGLKWAGRAYLFSGATGGLLRAFASPVPHQEDEFGWAVAGVDDTDGDGINDVLIGARLEDVGGLANAGRVYLFSGATGALLYALQSPRPNPEGFGVFGSSVTGIPDLDGDGRGDLGIGAWSEDGRGLDRSGRAYVFSGASGAHLHTVQSPLAEPEGFFGFAVAGMPDANGDGRGDGVVGAYREGSSLEGRAYLYHTAGSTSAWTAVSPPPADAAAADQAPEGPPAFALQAAVPNPFSSWTALRLTLPAATEVRAEVLDVLGRRVAVLADGPRAAGEHALRWEAEGLPGGVYVVRVRTGDGHAAARRVTLVR